MIGQYTKEKKWLSQHRPKKRLPYIEFTLTFTSNFVFIELTLNNLSNLYVNLK